MKLNFLIKNIKNKEKYITKNIHFHKSNINSKNDEYINKINIINLKNFLITEIFENNKKLLDKYLLNEINILNKHKNNDLIIKINNKPIESILNIYDYLNTNKNISSNNFINIDWKLKLRGGFIGDLIKAMLSIFKVFVLIPKGLMWIVQLFIWLIRFIIYLIMILLDLIKLDGIMGLLKFIVYEVIMFPFRILFDIIRYGFEKVQYIIEGAFVGYDNVIITKHKAGANIPNSESEMGEDEIFEEENCDNSSRKIYKTTDGTLPFSVIILTVLCPPIGVFMEYGVLGWFNILICALLTLAFYFPGLIYALILLYC